MQWDGTGTLVRITRGGICGSDLHYYQEGKVGSFEVKMPMILGHEVIGYVVESDDPQLQPNQKVAVNPSKPCGSCKYCLREQQNQCTSMRFSAAPCICRTWMVASRNTKWSIARSACRFRRRPMTA